MDRALKIATRKSPLAVWQAEFVRSQLQIYYPELDIELVKMSTQGDQMLNVTSIKDWWKESIYERVRGWYVGR